MRNCLICMDCGVHLVSGALPPTLTRGSAPKPIPTPGPTFSFRQDAPEKEKKVKTGLQLRLAVAELYRLDVCF